jgi:hypothetical protein
VEAKDAVWQAVQRGLDHPQFQILRYQIALINSDTAEMQRQIDLASGRPDGYTAFDWQASAAAFAGKWHESQELSRRAIDLARGGHLQEVAARYTAEQALRGAIVGDCRQARTAAAQGVKLDQGRSSVPRAALALALCGETNEARSLTEELGKSYPEDTLVNSIWLTSIRAAMELQRGDSTRALEQLQLTSRYEAAAEFWPQHLRGLALLKLGRSVEAAAEFQKVLGHRGYAPLSPLYPLAHLGMARALALTGETVKSRQAFEDLFVAWKKADADLPVMIAAKKEYERSK